MTDGLDIVPVRVKNEGGIVVRVIMRAKAGWPIVCSACTHGCGMESIDVGPAVCLQGNVHQSSGGIFFGQPKPGTIIAITGYFNSTRMVFGDIKQAPDTQWRKSLIVESCRACEIRNAKSDVINHILHSNAFCSDPETIVFTQRGWIFDFRQRQVVQVHSETLRYLHSS